MINLKVIVTQWDHQMDSLYKLFDIKKYYFNDVYQIRNGKSEDNTPEAS